MNLLHLARIFNPNYSVLLLLSNKTLGAHAALFFVGDFVVVRANISSLFMIGVIYFIFEIFPPACVLK